MSRGLRLAAAGLVIGLSAATQVGAPAWAGASPASVEATPDGSTAAVATVDRLNGALLDVMRQGGQLGGSGRFAKLQPVLDDVLNLPMMTQVAVGPRWSTLTPDQQHKLVDGFRRFTIATYVSHFDSFEGQRFEVKPTAQPITGGLLVSTQLVPRDKKPIQLDYVMRETDGKWQIVDVYAQGTISELARRRAEFTSVLSRDGADALADRLVEKAETLINQPA